MANGMVDGKTRVANRKQYNKKYDPDIHPEQLVDHMAQGLSYISFAGKVKVSPRTMIDWERKYEEWRLAKEVGFAAAQLWWEKEGKENLENPKFSGNMWYWNMKNRFKWADRQEVETTDKTDERKIRDVTVKMKTLLEAIKSDPMLQKPKDKDDGTASSGGELQKDAGSST